MGHDVKGSKRKAVVENLKSGYLTAVLDETGETHWLQVQGAEAGTEGYIVYHATRSRGLWYWYIPKRREDI